LWAQINLQVGSTGRALAVFFVLAYVRPFHSYFLTRQREQGNLFSCKTPLLPFRSDGNYRSIAIDHLNEQVASNNVKVVYIYFDYTVQQTQTCIDVACNILKQLLCQSEDVPPEVESQYNERVRIGARPGLAMVFHALASFSQKYAAIYAVFDAMDECSEDALKGIFALFAKLQESGYKLLISTRPHLQHKLGGTLPFEIAADNSDLRNYITARLEKEGNKNITLQDKCLDLSKTVKGV
jgi:hypothetical protein